MVLRSVSDSAGLVEQLTLSSGAQRDAAQGPTEPYPCSVFLSAARKRFSSLSGALIRLLIANSHARLM